MMAREITPEEILNLLRIQYHQRSGRLAFCCPVHDDRDPSAAAYLDTKLFHCFSCGFTVPPILFYAKATEQDVRSARKDLERTFGPLNEAKPRHNPHLLKLTRNRAEQELATRRDLGRKAHTSLGEMLDRILLAYERGQVDEEALDKVLKIWYNKVRGATDAEPIDLRIPETGPDAGLEEGARHLPGHGRQGNGPAVEPATADDTVDLA